MLVIYFLSLYENAIKVETKVGKPNCLNNPQKTKKEMRTKKKCNNVGEQNVARFEIAITRKRIGAKKENRLNWRKCHCQKYVKIYRMKSITCVQKLLKWTVVGARK